jgi:hypothetical protein
MVFGIRYRPALHFVNSFLTTPGSHLFSRQHTLFNLPLFILSPPEMELSRKADRTKDRLYLPASKARGFKTETPPDFHGGPPTARAIFLAGLRRREQARPRRLQSDDCSVGESVLDFPAPTKAVYLGNLIAYFNITKIFLLSLAYLPSCHVADTVHIPSRLA